MPNDGHSVSRRQSLSTLELFETMLPTLKDESRHCIYNLQRYHAPRIRARFPRSHSASVLVPLFVGRAGDLYVLLSRRSEALRAYAGDTALPGGKLEPQDVTVEDTARREAFEEIGLPQDKERVPLLCVLEPFLAGNQVIVTPVVVLILDKTLQPNLNSSEVTSIFSHPLASFLSSTPPRTSQGDKSTSPIDTSSRPYHTFTDYTWTDNDGQTTHTRTVRQHSFLTGREADGIKPVSGLTAAILIHTATTGYGRPPTFEFYPPPTSSSSPTPTPARQIAWALLSRTNPLRAACEREGIDPDRQAERVLRPRRSVARSRLRTVGGGGTAEEWKKMGMRWKGCMRGVGCCVGKGRRGGRNGEQQTGEVVPRPEPEPEPRDTSAPLSLAVGHQKHSGVGNGAEEEEDRQHADKSEERAPGRDEGGRAVEVRDRWGEDNPGLGVRRVKGDSDDGQSLCVRRKRDAKL